MWHPKLLLRTFMFIHVHVIYVAHVWEHTVHASSKKLRIFPLIIHPSRSQLCFIQHPPLVLSLTFSRARFLAPISSLCSHYSLSASSKLEDSRKERAAQGSRVTQLTLSSLNVGSNFTGTLNKQLYHHKRHLLLMLLDTWQLSDETTGCRPQKKKPRDSLPVGVLIILLACYLLLLFITSLCVTMLAAQLLDE